MFRLMKYLLSTFLLFIYLFLNVEKREEFHCYCGTNCVDHRASQHWTTSMGFFLLLFFILLLALLPKDTPIPLKKKKRKRNSSKVEPKAHTEQEEGKLFFLGISSSSWLR